MKLFPLLCLSTLSASVVPCAADEVLLIPDSDADSIWVFDAHNGDLINDSFITDPGSDNGTDVFNRPMEALIAHDGTILVVDQFSDVVSQFATDGSYLGIFSLEGTRDGSIMDNIRGGHVLSQGPDAGDVLIANAGGTNDLLVSQSNIKRLAPTTGEELQDFAFNRYGGIRGPFDVVEFNNEVLVADEGQDKIVRYTLEGKFNERFTSALEHPQLDFPQQMAVTSDNTLLICAFSSGVILEFDTDANLIGQLDPGTLELYRGIAELGNGNLLVTTTTGVFEVSRAGTVVETQALGSGFRYITNADIPTPLPRATTHAVEQITPIDQRDRATIINDERGRHESTPISTGATR